MQPTATRTRLPARRDGVLVSPRVQATRLSPHLPRLVGPYSRRHSRGSLPALLVLHPPGHVKIDHIAVYVHGRPELRHP